MNRNTSLEHLTGPRTYLPPPNHIIVRVPKLEQTKLGLYLPDGGAITTDGGEKLRPVGEVVAMGGANGEWGKYVDRWGGMWLQPGDTVLFHPNVLPVVKLEDDLFIVQWDMVYLVVRRGEHEGGVYHVPEGEAVENGGMSMVRP